MARIIKKFRSGESIPYAYNIRVFRGKNINGREVKPFQTTWYPPEGMAPNRAEKEAQKFAILFENECKHGKISADTSTVSEYLRYYVSRKESSSKNSTQSFYRSFFPTIDAEIGFIKLNKLTTKILNDFYQRLLTKPRRDAKCFSENKLAEIIAASGRTKRDIAKSCGIGVNTLTLAIQGKNIAYSTATALSTEFNTTVSKIFTIVAEPLSPKTIREFHNLISGMCRYAVSERAIPENPAAGCTLPRIDRHEADAFTVSELKTILSAIEPEPEKYKLFLRLLIETGCRRGEILALRWSDIDFDNKLIRITKTLEYTANHGVYENSTKTGQSRTLTISDAMCENLRRYKTSENELTEFFGRGYNSENRLFHSDNGSAINPGTISGWLNRIQTKYDLPHINAHKFRHSCASILCENNVDIATISKRLGHTRLSTTLDVYTHMLNQRDQIVADTISSIMWDDKK